MTYSMLITTMLCMWVTTSHAEMGFDRRYERDYNIFNPVTQYQADNPLNPANAYDPNSAFNPVNRYDPGNPSNPVNRYNPNNPFNPVNLYHPENPLNPANKPALFTRVRDETTEMPRETGAWRREEGRHT